MKLYLLRHGPAEDRASSGLDSDRALTASGRERVLAVAKVLVEEGEAPVVVVTSPLVRAVQTAEIVAIVSKLGTDGKTVDVRRELSPGGDAASLARAFASEGGKRVMLVGHDPDLSNLALSLLGTADVSFDKATVLGLHLPAEGGPATRRFVLDPKALRIHRS